MSLYRLLLTANQDSRSSFTFRSYEERIEKHRVPALQIHQQAGDAVYWLRYEEVH
jgi:hypothetical protein